MKLTSFKMIESLMRMGEVTTALPADDFWAVLCAGRESCRHPIQIQIAGHNDLLVVHRLPQLDLLKISPASTMREGSA